MDDSTLAALDQITTIATADRLYIEDASEATAAQPKKLLVSQLDARFATAAQGALADTALQPADIGDTVQGYSANLAAWSAVNPSAYLTAAQVALGYQPLNAYLTDIASLTPGAPEDGYVVAWDDTAEAFVLVDGGGGSGDVVGPASSVDNSIVRFDGETGKIIQDYTSNAPVISDAGVPTFPASEFYIGDTAIITAATLYIKSNVVGNFAQITASGSGANKQFVFNDNVLTNKNIRIIGGSGSTIQTVGTNQSMYLVPNGTGLIFGLRPAWFDVEDTNVGAVENLLTLSHNLSSGTPTSGSFGVSLKFVLESSTGANRDAGRLVTLWNVATHASRSADLIGYASDYNGEREIWRGRASGTAAQFAVLGATPVARQAHIADPSGGGTQDTEARTAINSILAALESFGFLATS